MYKDIAKPRPVQGRELSIIEYIGLPGAGKTTAAKAFISQSGYAVDPLSIRIINLESERRISRVAFKLKHILIRPVNSVNVARAILHCRRDVADGNALRFIGAACNMMFIVALLRSATISRTLVLDQGFYQGCWALLRSLRKHRRTALPVPRLFELAFPDRLSLKVKVMHIACAEQELLRRRHARSLTKLTLHWNDNADLSDEIDCIKVVFGFAVDHAVFMEELFVFSPDRAGINLCDYKKGSRN